jgi:thiamine-phosphate pyrophosphorylase
MPSTSHNVPRCSLYLITPPLSYRNAHEFTKVFAEVLAALPVASALVRLAPEADGEAKAIVPAMLHAAVASDCALLIENDPWLAARLGADGVHVWGAGDRLKLALEGLKPQRIVGAGALRTRDEAMTAGEAGADYVMFGEPRGRAPAVPLERLIERVEWWAEIFETPCVACADSFGAASLLARAGADFVALDQAIWCAGSPPVAAREAQSLLSHVAAEAS